MKPQDNNHYDDGRTIPRILKNYSKLSTKTAWINNKRDTVIKQINAKDPIPKQEMTAVEEEGDKVRPK